MWSRLRTAAQWLGPVALLGISMIALLLPALQNGYPLLFYDSGSYIASALHWDGLSESRPGGYSLFLRATIMGGSLWSVVFVQAAITLILAFWAAKSLFWNDPLRLWLAAGTTAAAALITDAGRYACWIMADATTSWLALGTIIFLVSEVWWERWTTAGLLFLVVLCHNMHLVMAASAAVVVAALVATRWRHLAPKLRGRFLGLSGLFAAAAVTAVLWHGIATGSFTLTRGSPTFFMGRLHAMGVLDDVLAAHCPERHFRLCEQQQRIAGGERVAEWFLWSVESPLFHGGGGWEQEGGEHSELLRLAMKCCAKKIFWAALRDSWRQLFRVDSHRSLQSFVVSKYVQSVIAYYLPKDASGMQRAAQINGRPLRTRLIPLPERATNIAFMVAALAALILSARWPSRRLFWALAGLWVFVLTNAFLVGLGSEVRDRYHGRIAWLFPFFVLLAIAFAVRCPRWYPEER